MGDELQQACHTDSADRRVSWSRRSLIASTLAAGGLAGCLGEDDSTDGTIETPSTTVASSDNALQTVDTTEAGDAEFEMAEDSYSITATGDVFSHSAEGYAGIYAPDAFESGMSVTVTLDSQDNTREWARTGLKVASDITDAGGSTGDLILVVTPGHGVLLQWDGDGDGYVGQDGNTQAGETTYPITLKLERQDTDVTGYYSTDGGDSFTEIGTASLSDPAAAMDVGMVHTTGNDQRGTATFSGFELGAIRTPTPVEAETEPVPLPDDADALDRIVFGNEPSEANHDFTAETSRLAAGRNGHIGRQISRNTPDAAPAETLGSCSFTMACDTDEQVHLTVKTQQDSPGNAGFVLFHGDEQVGYTVGKFDWGSMAQGGGIGRKGVVKGDWVYFTMVLPQSLTEGTDSVDLRLVFYQRPSSPGPIVQRAYTHTNELFALPADEEDTLGRDIGEPWGEGNDGDIDTAIATMTENVENAVATIQQKDSPSRRAVEHLARATRRDWIESLDREAVFEIVRETMDESVVLAATDADETEGWARGLDQEPGLAARAFVILADEFESRGLLSEPIAEHPEDIPRAEAYADFCEQYVEIRQQDRRSITNQVANATETLIALADALELLAPDRAPSQEKYDAWIDQVSGIEPLQKLPGEGEPTRGDYLSGVFHNFSEAGLNREQRYSASYGLTAFLSLTRLIEDTGIDRLDGRLQAAVEGMGWFRWRGVDRDDDRRRVSIQNGWLSARGGVPWPGLGKYNTWLPYGRAPACLDVLGSDADIAKRWAELMIEDGTEFNTYEGSPARLYHMLHVADGIRKLKAMEPSTYELPSERDRGVFGDPDQGMVSITDGEFRIQACLGMGHGRHQSNIVRYDYQGPNSHRGGTTMLRRREFPLDRTVERPNGVVHWQNGLDRWDLSEPYLPWRGEHRSVDQYLAREDVPEREVPVAGRPEGGAWPDPDNWGLVAGGSYHTGFTYFYREAQIGPYRIGINPTGDDEGQKRGFGQAQSFAMEVPDSGAIDVATGEPIEDDTVNVGPRETRVLKIPDR